MKNIIKNKEKASEDNIHNAYDAAIHDMMEEEDFIPMDEDPDMKIILEEED